MEQRTFERAVAHRIFAAEFQEANLTFREGEDQYSPQYILTPTGAKCSRIFLVGTLTEKTNVARDEREAEYWRARLVDPTGYFYIYAGQYQPEAAQVLAGTEPPEFLAVVGKPSIYTTPEGATLNSVRAEFISIVDNETRDTWVLETARLTLKRLKDLEERKTENAVRALEHYSTDTQKYRSLLKEVLQALETGL